MADQQSGRISVTFKASKPILPLKRPSSDYQFNSACDVNSSARGFVTKRVPLSEVPLNTRGNAIGNEYYCGPSSPGVLSEKATTATVVSAGKENVCQSCFETPRKEPECAKKLDCFSVTSFFDDELDDSVFDEIDVPGLLDDEFDESVFEEIDILVQQKSAEKAALQELETSIDEKILSEVDVVEDVTLTSETTYSEGIRIGDLLSIGVDLEPREEEMDNLKCIQSGNMPEAYLKYLKSLNDRQREAACTDISTPLMIVAGPGSGKTSTMVGRVLMLLNEGISASNILAMTFTTAAASEMRERIGSIAGKATAKELTISTFHSFSLQLCRAHGEKIGRTSEFLIYGQGQQRNAVIEAVRLLENGKSRHKDDGLLIGEMSKTNPNQVKDQAKKWLKFVTQAKASGRTSAEYRALGNEIGAEILENYNNILKSCNALDYHDLISCSVKLLNDFPEGFLESRCY